MKRLLFVLTFMSLTFPVIWGQTKIQKYAGTAMPYPNRTDSSITFRDGMTPFYINHLGRHGARFPTSRKALDKVEKVLVSAQQENGLTSEGMALLSMIRRLSRLFDGQWGKLSKLGETEQEGIAGRMIRNYPQLFSNSAKIEAIATYVPRSINSMDAFLSCMIRHNPALQVQRSEGKQYNHILRFFDLNKSYVNYKEKGDWISLDYEGYVDDQPSDDLSESGAVIQVGARNLFNAAFERGLMGLKLGETYNLNVTFAEDDADPDVAGKTITFSVEVNAKFNDAYAKKMSKNKYPNVKAYYEYAKAKEEKENREGIGDTVWEDLLKECNVKKYPAGSRKQAYKDQKRSYQVFAKVSGQSYEEFIGALGQTDEDIQSSADDQVKARMTAKTIAIKEGLTLSDADYERFLLAFLEPEEEEDKTLKAMEKRYLEEQSCYPRDDMLIELVKEYLGKNSKMK